jgi:hydrogenase/urease accessory protein HupE
MIGMSEDSGGTLPLSAVKPWGVALAVVALLAIAAPVQAHPAPFSFLDARLQGTTLDLAVVVHVFDIAHDLGVEPPELLLDPAVLASKAAAIDATLTPRLRVLLDGAQMPVRWSATEGAADRQAIRLRATISLERTPGTLGIDALLFPYDPVHQTFVNIYEGDALASQAILSVGRTGHEYFTGSRQGTWAVIRKFVPAGVHHILIGPDHILFLVGLLLLGGSLRRLLLVVSGFTIAHSITLSLAALNILSPPSRIVEPAIALSIVYVGVDNLMVRDGRDVRTWIAFAFGFIHGFGFASVLREMDLPAKALGWSLFSFNVGVEIGQMLIVVLVASVFSALRARSAVAGRRLVYAGSIAVIAAGAFWFVQRVFFPGGLA